MKTTTEKICPMCKSLKQSSEFYKNHRDGLSPYCKSCSAARKRKGDKTRAEITASVYPSDTTKICSKCKIEKPVSDFNTRVRKSGLVNYKPYCRQCQGNMFSQWAVKTERQKSSGRAEMLEKVKANRYPSENMKLCSTCNTVKSKEDFGHRFEVGGSCKACRSILEKQNYAQNFESRRKYAANYRIANLDSVREMARRGAKIRNERLKASRENGRVTVSQKLEFVAKHGYVCMCCGKTESITFDHVVPISKGGADVIENMQLLCVSCNSSKGSNVIDYRNKEKIAA